jgi:tetratricopeptide (TPR) repeat protein
MSQHPSPCAAIFCILLATTCSCSPNKPAAPGGAREGREVEPAAAQAPVAEEQGAEGRPPADPRPAPESPGELVVLEPAAPDPVCESLLGEIRALKSRLPRLLTDMERPRDEVERDLEEATALSERYLATCAGAPGAPLVEAWLGRFLATRYLVALEEHRKSGKYPPEALGRVMREYVARIQVLAEGALAHPDPGAAARCEALSVLADIASERLLDYAMHRRFGQEYLDECPDAPRSDRASFLFSMAMSFVWEGRYDEGVEFARRVAERHRGDAEWVLYTIALFEALHGAGDLEGMKELIQLMQAEFPKRLEMDNPPLCHVQYQQWYDIGLFWLGYVYFAEGDLEAARNAFQGLVDHIEGRRQQLQKGTKALPAVQGVFRDHLTPRLLRFLEEDVGRVPEVDLEAEVDWITEKKVSLKRERGNVVGILFRAPRRENSQSFLMEMGRLAREYPRFTGVTLTFITQATPERRAQRATAALAELDELGLPLAAGCDLTPDTSIFVRLRGIVGSPSFVLLDPEGRFAWYVIDPKDRDCKVLAKVVARLLAKTGPEAPESAAEPPRGK